MQEDQSEGGIMCSKESRTLELLASEFVASIAVFFKRVVDERSARFSTVAASIVPLLFVSFWVPSSFLPAEIRRW